MSSRKEKKCKIGKCKREYRAKGYCDTHYKKWKRDEYGTSRYKICGNEGCHKTMIKKGMCAAHYEAWSKSRKGKVEVTAAAKEAPTSSPEPKEETAQEEVVKEETAAS